MNRTTTTVSLLLVFGMWGCGVTPTVTNLQPGSRGSTYVMQGLVDTNDPGNAVPAACNGMPTPPAPDAAVWWSGIDTQTRDRVVVTGFQLWSNTLPGCANARQDMYRGQFAYDLTALRALSTANSPIANRINSATLRLTIQGGTTKVSTSRLACFPLTGGVNAVNHLKPGTPILSGLTRLNLTADFPPTDSRIEQLIPPPASLPGTVGRATISPGGQGLATVDLDVKDFVLGALNRGDGAIGFSTIGVAETVSHPTGDEMLDCRTFLTPGALSIKSL